MIEPQEPRPGPRGRAPERRVPPAVRALLAVLVVGVVGLFAWSGQQGGGAPESPAMRLYDALIVLAAVIVAIRAVVHRLWPWAAVAVGMASWALGDIVASGSAPGPAALHGPSLADLCYLLFYPLVFAGLVGLLLHRVGRPRRTVWLDALVVALGSAAYIWLWFAQAVPDPRDLSVGLLTDAAYPVGDFLLLSLLIGILALLAWPADAMWLLLTAGLVLFAVGDSLYFLQAAQGSGGSPQLSLVWLAAFTFVALAVWVPARADPPNRSAVRALAVPGVVAVAAFLLLVVAGLTEVPAGSTLLAAAAIVVAAWRSGAVLRGVSVRDAMRRQAQTDGLTGLGNRRLLNARLDDLLEDRSDGDRVAVVLLDVTGFRAVNDSFGHAVGDEVLWELARRLRGSAPRGATLVRLGADEFAAVLAPGTSLDGAAQAAGAVAEAMAHPFAAADRAIHLDVAVGVAVCPDHALTRGDLLHHADAALHRAREEHAPYAVFDASADGAHRDRLRVIEDLRDALAEHQLVCWYQPKLDLRDGRVHEVETLVRWQHPERGLVFPDTFLPLAEQAGLMRRLTEEVLDLAIGQAAEWRRDGLAITVAVNLSMTNLLDLGLPAVVEQLLASHHLPTGSLVLEITETEFMADPERAMQVVDTLHRMGVAISVDDYGKGYSSLGQLGALKADEIKLDAAFVTGVGDREDLQGIVRSTVSLARDLGLVLVAEGVETQTDLATIRRLGCDLAQGYFVRRPAPAAEITEWLRSPTVPSS